MPFKLFYLLFFLFWQVSEIFKNAKEDIAERITQMKENVYHGFAEVQVDFYTCTNNQLKIAEAAYENLRIAVANCLNNN